MRFPKSKTGLALAIIYLIVVAIGWFYILNCNDLFCGFFIIKTLFPWPFVLEELLKSSLYLSIFWYLYVFLTALNSIIIYFIGKSLEIFTKKFIYPIVCK